MDTPLTRSSAASMSHSVARSIVTGASKQPPPPPATRPPEPTEVVKILCFGSDSETRTRWIRNLARKDSAPTTNSPRMHLRTEREKEWPCVLCYDKKSYSFQSLSGEERYVLIQFFHPDGLPSKTPPPTWEEHRSKLKSALLIIDLRFIISLWETGALESHLEERKNLVNQWGHHRLPVNLLLANVWHESQPIAPAKLLRVGDAIAQACRKTRIRNWFFMGPESDSPDGLDSIDAVLQSLVNSGDSNSGDPVAAVKPEVEEESSASKHAADTTDLPIETDDKEPAEVSTESPDQKETNGKK